MGLLTTGMMQPWLPLVFMVLSQLITLLFIGAIDRVIRCWPGRSVPAQPQAREAASPAA